MYFECMVYILYEYAYFECTVGGKTYMNTVGGKTYINTVGGKTYMNTHILRRVSRGYF